MKMSAKNLILFALGVLIPGQAIADALLESAINQAAKSPERIRLEWKNAVSPTACSASLVQRKPVAGGCEFKILTTKNCATPTADTVSLGAPFSTTFSKHEVTAEFSDEGNNALGLLTFQSSCVDAEVANLSPINPVSLGSLCHVRYEHRPEAPSKGLFSQRRQIGTVNSAVGFLRESENGSELETLAPARPVALENTDLGSPVFCEVERKPVFAGVITGKDFNVSTTDQMVWVRETLGLAKDRSPGFYQPVSRQLAVLPIEDAAPRATQTH